MKTLIFFSFLLILYNIRHGTPIAHATLFFLSRHLKHFKNIYNDFTIIFNSYEIFDGCLQVTYVAKDR